MQTKAYLVIPNDHHHHQPQRARSLSCLPTASKQHVTKQMLRNKTRKQKLINKFSKVAGYKINT